MNERLDSLFNTIVTEHIKTAEPVGSNLLATRGAFNLSPATIRNEMIVLENEGLIYQPYTSAGRVPTEKGYRYFVQNFLRDKKLNSKVKQILADNFTTAAPVGFKELAKKIRDLSGETVLIGFSATDVYYTGLSNLFSKPEFKNPDVVYNLSRILDSLDEMILNIFAEIKEEMEILIGEDNPFSSSCSLVVAKYNQSDQENPRLLGILGPVRMNYEYNLALLKYSRNLIQS